MATNARKPISGGRRTDTPDVESRFQALVRELEQEAGGKCPRDQPRRLYRKIVEYGLESTPATVKSQPKL